MDNVAEPFPEERHGKGGSASRQKTKIEMLVAASTQFCLLSLSLSALLFLCGVL